MKQIKFSKPKQGSPSFCEIEGYISKEKANALLRDLIDFNNKVLLKDSIISDKGTRLNIFNGDKNYFKLLKFSDEWKSFDKSLFDGRFFKKIFDNNVEIFKSKGIKTVDYKYDVDYSDYFKFSTEFRHRLLKKLMRVFKYKHIKSLFSSFFSKRMVVYPIINIATSKTGYNVPIHTDNRYKIFVGLIYLNTLEDNAGGRTLLFESINKQAEEEYKRSPNGETKIIKEVAPIEGNALLFINSNDAYHAASLLKNDIKIYFIYFSFGVKWYESIWKTNYKVIDGSV